MVSSRKFTRMDYTTRQQRMIFDGVMCFGVPVIFMALHSIVQGHRFVIVENFGCEPDIYESAPAIMLIWLPQLLPPFLTLIYAAFALYNFISRRRSFAAHLQTSDSALTTNQYLRLVAVCLMLMCCSGSFAALSAYDNLKAGLNPWISWAHVHRNFSHVDLVSAVEMPHSVLTMRMVLWAGIPAGAFVFFVCFSFGKDAEEEYRKVWLAFRHRILRQDIEQAQATKWVPIDNNQRPMHIAMVELAQDAEQKKLSF